MIGHQFKFIADNGEKYLISNRYPVIQDASDNINNYYDPMRQIKSKPKNLRASNFLHAVQNTLYEEDIEYQDLRKEQSMKYVQLENIQDMLDLEE